MSIEASEPSFRPPIDGYVPVRAAGAGLRSAEGPIRPPGENQLPVPDAPSGTRRRWAGRRGDARA